MPIRILFVDDEPNILSGLRRMLRPMRHRWNMDFVCGGPDALQYVQREECDVIVTDMKMPGMDGSQLLADLLRADSGIIRLVLSGQAAEDSAGQVILTAHQYLSKPCNPAVLIDKLTQIDGLVNAVIDKRLRRGLTGLGRIPCGSESLSEFLEIVNRPDPCYPSLLATISSDPGMTTKFLQIANSAFCGLAQSVDSPREALVRLGTTVLKSLGVEAAFQPIKSGSRLHERFQDMKRRSDNMVSLVSQAWQRGLLEPDSYEFAQTAARMIHVGELALMATAPEPYLRATDRNELPVHLAIKKAFGTDLSVVTQYVLGIWGLPNTILDAVAWGGMRERVPCCCPKVLGVLHALSCRLDGSELDSEFLAAVGLPTTSEAWEFCPESRPCVRPKVLFVDDDDCILMAYRRLLRKEVCVEIAQGAAEGLAKVDESGPFAVVLSDYAMPEMTGGEFLAQVQQRSPSTVCMLLTGNRHAVRDGVGYQVLEKPCPREVLLTAIRKAIEPGRRSATNRQGVAGSSDEEIMDHHHKPLLLS